MNSGIDVLNLETASYPTRDRQVATLVCNYLRYMGYHVVELPIFNGLHYFNKLHPKIVFTVNSTGGKLQFRLIKEARKRNFTVVTLIAEGNIIDGGTTDNTFLWGYNTDKKLFEDVRMIWSERSRKIFLKYYPELDKKLKISGGVGFDAYLLATKRNQFDFLKQYHKQDYTKVIGIGCTNFSSFYEEKHSYYEYVQRKYSQEEIERVMRDKASFNSILKDIIKYNPKILFFLKKHPMDHHGGGGIEGLEVFENTLILKSEEPIIDCISVCDMWLVYDSTTALEAWLLNKPTGHINPSGTDIPDLLRSGLYKGSPNFDTAEKLQTAIDHFYKNHSLPGFEELEDNREQCIEELIQWGDGLNHVRAGNEILDILEDNNFRKIKPPSLFMKLVTLIIRILWWYAPIAGKYKLPFPFNTFLFYNKGVFDYTALKKYADKRMEEQIAFYQRSGLKKEDLRKIRCK